MTHTPGPWRVGIVSGAVIADHPIEGGCLGSDDVEHYGGHLIAESVAECNKPLIAAAPELLDALKSFERMVVELYPGHVEPDGEHLGEYQAVWAAVHNARAAIAKATGGAA